MHGMKKLIAATLMGLAAVSAQAAGTDDAIQRIKSAGVLKVCVVDYAPLSQRDPRGTEWTGMYIELANKIGETLGTPVEYVDSGWKTFVQNVQTGKCDFSIAPSYPTAARAVEVLFSSGISEDGQAAWVRADSELKTIADLDSPDRTIAVRAGSANERIARQVFKNATIKPIVSDVQPASLMEVATRRVDAAFIARMSAENVLSNNPNIKDIKMLGEPLFPSSIAWALPLGEYHLQQFLNTFLVEMEENGEMQKLRNKWLTAK